MMLYSLHKGILDSYETSSRFIIQHMLALHKINCVCVCVFLVLFIDLFIQTIEEFIQTFREYLESPALLETTLMPMCRHC